MIVLGFRTKLLLAMMAVVIGVTVATILATQSRVQQTYERIFKSQVEIQIQFFTRLQEARLGGVRQKCRDLNRSVRLRAALEEADAEVLYDRNNALSELRDILAESSPEATRDDRPAQNRAAFLAFVDAQGQIVAPLETEQDLLPAMVRQRLERILPAIRSGLQNSKPVQRIGHMPVELAPGQEKLLETILTRIADPDDGRLLGAMVVGFPLSEGSESAAHEPDQIRTAIWIEQGLHPALAGAGLPTNLVHQLGTRIQGANSDDTFDLGTGVNQTRVFFRRLNSDSIFPPAYRVCLYPLREMLEEQERLVALIVAFGGMALVAALALSLVLSHGLAVPIHALVAGTNAVRAGDYTVKVPVRSRDELGRLAESFNEMAAGLVEREQYHSILGMTADPKIAAALVKGGARLGGETREVSVLFCDIRGFTGLTQNMAPADVITMLNEHFTPLARVVHEHDGAVDKFVGDLIMALFGAPTSHGNDAASAARCAWHMIEARTQLNRSSQYRIEVGIGVATGPALAGCMGSTDRLNYTVLGERVNLASRLCSKAGRMEVVIDQTTRDRLGPTALVEPLADLELKGFTGKVPAFRLLGFREPASS